MKNKIEAYLKNIDLDIRKTGDARFFDQKVQPDVLSAVCECILNYVNISKEFTNRDIKECEFSNEIVTEIFNKPNISLADSEFNKFFGQPIKMLAYCGLLYENKDKKPYKYTIVNKELIEYISLRDRNAYYFISVYLEKVLKDSAIWNYFDNFFKIQDKNSLYELRDKYVVFIKKYTNIKKDKEPIRIFNPLLRTIAFKLKKLGTNDGGVSEVNFNDLLYNQPNWRDLKKDKSITKKNLIKTL